MCVLCNGLDSVAIEYCRDGYKVLKCLNCGLVYVDPMPPKDFIKEAYLDEYYIPCLKD